MKKTIGEQVAQFMEERDLKPAAMAAMCKTTRQNIEGLIKRNRFPRGYIDRLAAAMNTSVDILIAGKMSPEVRQADDRAFSPDVVGDVAQNSDAQQTIPTSMKYTAPNLRSAIMLIGNLLGALDEPSRDIVGDILLKVAKHSTDPGRVKDYAEKAATLATVQMPISENANLNKAMRPRKHAVETGHGNLEH